MTPATVFFAAYVGPSMNPTLHEAEVMEIRPYDGRSPRVGDVVLFSPPNHDRPVVHRIIRVTAGGISTLGDNNTKADIFHVRPQNISGQVVAVWRGQKRREIAGGLQGRLTSLWRRWRRSPGRAVSSLLHPVYEAVSRRRFIARLLPAPFRPRVVVFHTQGQAQFQLLAGHRIIGRYDDQTQRWQIQRPFRVFVDERALQRPQGDS